MNEAKPPDRLSKHLDIYNAIKDIGQLLERVRELNSRICGPVPVAETEKTPDEPTLSVFLNGSAEKIRSELDRIHQMLSEIEQALF